MYIGHHVKYPLFLSDFNETHFFSMHFGKNPQISNLMKIRPAEAEFYEDGQTDMTELTVDFSDFATSPPKNTTHFDRTCAAPRAV